MAQPHPLDQLRAEEIVQARDVIIQAWPGSLLQFRSIFLEEPTKSLLIPFLKAEHNGTLNDDTPRPPRLARVQYDVVKENKFCGYTESVVDVNSKHEVSRQDFDTSCQPYLTM
ncbi:copper amine oxidase [Coccidioides immitis RMSCC 3703]|nr:copper amine oxidase [Coccidioides immitis RMSCC 3703]